VGRRTLCRTWHQDGSSTARGKSLSTAMSWRPCQTSASTSGLWAFKAPGERSPVQEPLYAVRDGRNSEERLLARIRGLRLHSKGLLTHSLTAFAVLKLSRRAWLSMLLLTIDSGMRLAPLVAGQRFIRLHAVQLMRQYEQHPAVITKILTHLHLPARAPPRSPA
jgi:hypothetical protein